MNTDNSEQRSSGWYLDDVRVYTCGGALVPRSVPKIKWQARPWARELKAPATGCGPAGRDVHATTGYADGTAIAGARP